jgi:hypothetical protein
VSLRPRIRIKPPTYGSVEIAIEKAWVCALQTGNNVLLIWR